MEKSFKKKQKNKFDDEWGDEEVIYAKHQEKQKKNKRRFKSKFDKFA